MFALWNIVERVREVMGIASVLKRTKEKRIRTENVNDEVEVDVVVENPVLVHCSAGCGRTGAYVAVDSLLAMMFPESSMPSQAVVRSVGAGDGGSNVSEGDEAAGFVGMEMDKSGASAGDEMGLKAAEEVVKILLGKSKKEEKESEQESKSNHKHDQYHFQHLLSCTVCNISPDHLSNTAVTMDAVMTSVLHLRCQRFAMVQTMPQFLFLYEMLLARVRHATQMQQDQGAAFAAVVKPRRAAAAAREVLAEVGRLLERLNGSNVMSVAAAGGEGGARGGQRPKVSSQEKEELRIPGDSGDLEVTNRGKDAAGVEVQDDRQSVVVTEGKDDGSSADMKEPTVIVTSPASSTGVALNDQSEQQKQPQQQQQCDKQELKNLVGGSSSYVAISNPNANISATANANPLFAPESRLAPPPSTSASNNHVNERYLRPKRSFDSTASASSTASSVPGSDEAGKEWKDLLPLEPETPGVSGALMTDPGF
jgi:hypothetical protein